jgi:SAM-dependent methyltransferase
VSVVESFKLRGRLRAMSVLEDAPAPEPTSAAQTAESAASAKGNRHGKRRQMLVDLGPAPSSTATGDFSLVTADGVEVDDATSRAAVRYARRHDADVVELVPGDLPVAALIELLRTVDPPKYTHDRLHQGVSAGHATLVRSGLLHELDVETTTGLDPLEHVNLAKELKLYAPTTCHLVLAPGLAARDLSPSRARVRAEAIYQGSAKVGMPMSALGSAVMALAPLASLAGRRRVLPAYLTHLLRPLVVATGSGARPSDLRPLPLVARAGRDLVRTVRTMTAERPAVVTRQADEADRKAADRRASYAARAQDLAGFFEPRRSTCPWCEGEDLVGLVDVPDLIQRKPGEFHLDQCRSCQHIFQNPRLSLDGLDYYYSDFYDGIGGDGTAFVFSSQSDTYRVRAGMLEGVAQPKRWLDVGTGHGHFCLVAREIWPETRFDGLDMSVSIVEAGRRGWVDNAYQGLFPELAPDLTGAYDVVSMHHYLEHTRDPRAEIEAAATALESGGHLLIEVPDPDSRLGRLLSPYWVPWFQPQHQHFVRHDNLCAELEDRGFAVVASHRAEAHIPVDLGGAVRMVVENHAPAAAWPWLPEPSRSAKVKRAAMYVGAVPGLLAGTLADHAVNKVGRHVPGLSNAYRVLARKD